MNNTFKAVCRVFVVSGEVFNCVMVEVGGERYRHTNWLDCQNWLKSYTIHFPVHAWMFIHTWDVKLHVSYCIQTEPSL